MKQPELLYSNSIGATVHSYHLTGGKSDFQRYLACFLGSCHFYNTFDEAKNSVNHKFP